MDVSAYLVNAATRQMAEVEVAEAQFAGLDALIAAAEEEASALPPLPETAEGDLTEEERREVRAAMDLVYGAAPLDRGDAPPRLHGRVRTGRAVDGKCSGVTSARHSDGHDRLHIDRSTSQGRAR
ncbi:hypothetical protein Y717_31310 [Streptomyces scopuliridis RB72]|uniref:Uncharacterized protein n=2 Tax=Streptomyces scopuliridis TaxID=452529 RepID=A0A2T7T941_9ACTN|nr:hypothetical protein Y717_31310 [Streptomyces scopuliridis RB72]